MTKNDWLKVASLLYFSLILTGCGNQVGTPMAPNEVTLPPMNITQTALAQQPGDVTSMPSNLPTPASGLENLIRKAQEDLAQRLSTSADQITLLEATEVEWSDSSLDCTQPGMEYLQVITPGYRILLEANGIQYAYHTNRDAYIVFCDNANPPSLPKP